MIINRELFEAWLFSQDRGRMFNFNDCRNCLLGSFLKEQLGLRLFTVLKRRLIYNEADHKHPDWFIKLTEKWADEPTKRLDYAKIHSFGEAQDSYLQLFPDTLVLPWVLTEQEADERDSALGGSTNLDSNQSQTEAPSAPVAKELGTSLNQVVSSQKCD